MYNMLNVWTQLCNLIFPFERICMATVPRASRTEPLPTRTMYHAPCTMMHLPALQAAATCHPPLHAMGDSSTPYRLMPYCPADCNRTPNRTPAHIVHRINFQRRLAPPQMQVHSHIPQTRLQPPGGDPHTRRHPHTLPFPATGDAGPASLLRTGTVLARLARLGY